MHIQACLFRFTSARSAVLPVVFWSSLIFFLVFPFTTCRTSAAETSQREKIDILLAMSLEELMKVEIISASKRPQTLVEAPSPIYVFTAEDIQRTGVRNIMELIKFIPGFYVYPRLDQTFVIASRGLRSDQNDKFLFLIDGIPLNNISQDGAVNAHIFPGLDMVKRVEVIAGPGSTMWGSDATLGIFNIITKDAKDIDGIIANVDVASEDNHRAFNLLAGKEFDGGEIMLSATFAENDGFGDPSHGFKNYVYDFGTASYNDDRGYFNHLHPSYEIYGKLRLKDFTFKALVSEKSIYSFWNTSQSTFRRDMQDKESTFSSKDIHLELSHHAELSDKMTLDTKLTAHEIKYVRDKLVEHGTNHGSNYIDDPSVPNVPDGPDVFVEPVHRTEYFPEQGIGLEFIFNWDINKKNKLLAGASARVVDAGPAEIKFTNTDTGEPIAGGANDILLYNETTDRTFGAYVEDTYYATDKLTLIGGVRVDYNEPREESLVFMPRAAAIYKLTDALALKYMYNTGYVRPQMAKSFAVALNKQGSVKESEKIRSHDVALIYNDEKTQLIVDAFYMEIYDLYTYNSFTNSHVNTGDIFTKGLEVSLKRSFFEGKLLFDLNYGYATAEKEDESGDKSTFYLGIPHHLYAAGLTYQFTDKISLNGNVTGWLNLDMNYAPVTAGDKTTHPDDYNGEYLVNFNLRFANLLKNHLNISLYVLNVFDYEARLQALEPNYMAWWSYARGRSVGIKASWKF